MRIVFCGTPGFAVPTLEALVDAGHTVSLTVTQPDRAAGRGMELRRSSVKRASQQLEIPVVQPETIRNNVELRMSLEAVRPDAIVVVAYGRIIPEWMLAVPRFGNINLHGSLLPKYRGAAPIQWAVADGLKTTGVTTMLLDAGLDTGPMLLAESVLIGPEETAVDLSERLAGVGAGLMVRTLAGLEDGSIRPVEQDPSFATRARALQRADGLVDFSRAAALIYDRWRGFQPWPGAFTTFRGKKIILSRVREGESFVGEPGTLAVNGGALIMICGEGTSLVLEEVQLEGKRRLSAAEFLRGYQVKDGERVGG